MDTIKSIFSETEWEIITNNGGSELLSIRNAPLSLPIDTEENDEH